MTQRPQAGGHRIRQVNPVGIHHDQIDGVFFGVFRIDTIRSIRRMCAMQQASRIRRTSDSCQLPGIRPVEPT